jgi:GDP-L-fucose synthase
MKNTIFENYIITGGSGMVGSAFKEKLPNATYPNRQELYSTLREDTKGEEFGGKNIIHLAAKVGGIKANMEQIADFYFDNSSLNQKVLSAAHNGQANKVLCLLSTCVYPDAPYVKYPLTEDQLHLGPPHHSNFGYAYSKRMVDVMSRAYRQQYGCNFITAIPNNLYGKNDNFDLENGHVIPALIRKIWQAKVNNKQYVECWGDGSPLREFTYSEDIVKILLFLMKNYNEPEPINIGNTEEHSIKEVVEIICKILDYNGEVKWQINKPSGQFRKPSCNKKLLDLGWSKKDYTSLQIGLQKTCKWFIMHYPNIRGI